MILAGQLFVVERGGDFIAEENHQAAAAPDVLLQALRHRLGKAGDVGEHHGIEVIKARGGKFWCGDTDGLDEIIRLLARRHRDERVPEEERFAVARLIAGIAIDQQHAHFLDGADGERALVVGRQAVFRNARHDGMKTFRPQLREERHALAAAGRE